MYTQNRMRLLLICLLGTSCFSNLANAQQTYRLTDLGEVRAGTHFAISDAGQVIIDWDSDTSRFHGNNASLWSEETGRIPFSVADSVIHGINLPGQIAGERLNPLTNEPEAFVWDPSSGITDLGRLLDTHTYSRALAINDSSQVVGVSGNDSELRGFVWSSGTGMTEVGQLPGPPPPFLVTVPRDINNSGVVIGGQGLDAFTWTQASGTAATEALPGAATQTSVAINNLGEILLLAETIVSLSPPAAVFETVLVNPATGLSSISAEFDGTGLNDNGQIIGRVFETRTAVIADREGSFDPLISMVDESGSGWTLEYPADINSDGQIVGSGRFNGVERGFLLTPNPAARLGDFDGNGVVDAADIDFYSGRIGMPAEGDLAELDLNDDGAITLADHGFHVQNLVDKSTGPPSTFTGTFLGDANLDHAVTVLGDATAFIGNLGTSGDKSWSDGDFNADNRVDVLNDGVLLIANLGRSRDASEPAVVVVPEPGSVLVIALGALATTIRRDPRATTANASHASPLR